MSAFHYCLEVLLDLTSPFANTELAILAISTVLVLVESEEASHIHDETSLPCMSVVPSEQF